VHTLPLPAVPTYTIPRWRQEASVRFETPHQPEHVGMQAAFPPARAAAGGIPGPRNRAGTPVCQVQGAERETPDFGLRILERASRNPGPGFHIRAPVSPLHAPGSAIQPTGFRRGGGTKRGYARDHSVRRIVRPPAEALKGRPLVAQGNQLSAVSRQQSTYNSKKIRSES